MAVAALVGFAFSPRWPGWLVVAALAATGVAVLGALEDRGSVSTTLRFATQGAAAAMVVAAGVRADVLDLAALDVALTAGWILLVTNGFRRLDHVDGLSAAMAALAAAGLVGVAGSRDPVVSVIAVALAGACVGLLVFNARPASVALGRGGAGFAGFVLAVGVVQFEPNTATPGGLLVPLLLLGLPILDLAVVNASRTWRGAPLSTSRRDHLVHRLRAAGWSRPAALATLLGAQAVMVGTAVLVAREAASPVVGVVIGVTTVLVLTLASVRDAPPGHHGPVTSGRRWLQIGVGAFLLLGGLSLLAAWQATREVQSAEAAIEAALDAGHRGDAGAAQVAFTEAAASFERAESWLESPLGWFGRALPVVAENFRAARELADGGADVARAGQQLSAAAGERLQVIGGTVRVDEVRRLTPEIEEAEQLVRGVVDTIDGLRRSYLIGPVGDRVDEADARFTTTAREAVSAVAAAHVAPAIFGADEPRHYFLAVQNNAELRATGGIIGNWGILNAVEGKVTLDDFQRTRLLNELGVSPEASTRELEAPPEYLERYSRFTPAQVWQNLNVTPDFPTVGRLIADLLPQSGVTQPVDGVIAVDPLGLQALLELTGPITVPSWPTPITVENVVDVTLRQAYEVFANNNDAREDFLGDVAEEVWDTATEVDLGNPGRISRALGRAGRDGHLMLWFSRPEEQELAVELGIAGKVPPLRSDSLLVTSQNASANKVDYYLKRQIDYALQLEPIGDGDEARATGQLQLRLENGAPAGGLSAYAIGPWDARFQPGENRDFVSVYTPLGFTEASLDGLPVPLEPGTELGRNVFSAYVSIPARSSRTLAVELDGRISLSSDGWYELDIPRQPTLQPDEVSVSIEVPPGWRLADAHGLEMLSPTRAAATIELDRTTSVRIKLVRDGE